MSPDRRAHIETLINEVADEMISRQGFVVLDELVCVVLLTLLTQGVPHPPQSPVGARRLA